MLLFNACNADADSRTIDRHLMGPHHDACVGDGKGVFFAGDTQLQLQLAGSAFQVDAQ
ncbi:hypothetical protein D3C76_1414890 [compost metagenome]